MPSPDHDFVAETSRRRQRTRSFLLARNLDSRVIGAFWRFCLDVLREQLAKMVPWQRQRKDGTASTNSFASRSRLVYFMRCGLCSAHKPAVRSWAPPTGVLFKPTAPNRPGHFSRPIESRRAPCPRLRLLAPKARPNPSPGPTPWVCSAKSSKALTGRPHYSLLRRRTKSVNYPNFSAGV